MTLLDRAVLLQHPFVRLHPQRICRCIRFFDKSFYYPLKSHSIRLYPPDECEPQHLSLHLHPLPPHPIMGDQEGLGQVRGGEASSRTWLVW